MVIHYFFLCFTLLIPTIVSHEPAGLPVCTLACPRGLKNCGNSCYLNATLQCLYAMKSLRDFLVKNQQLYADNSPTKTLINFFEIVQQSSEPIISKKIMKNFYIGVFDPLMQDRTQRKEPKRQQDAQEFLNLVLEHIEEDGRDNDAKKLINQAIEKLYRINLNTKTICKNAQGNRVKSETKIEQADLVSIETTGKTLEDCLQSFITEEKLEPENNVSWCKNLNGIGYRVFRLAKEAEYLIIQLKIFEIKYESGKLITNKILTPIIIPALLNLTPYLEKQVPTNYQLIGAAIHSGTDITFGHYTAYIWPEEEKKWYFCDDKTVIEQTPPFIQQNWQPGAGDTARPYLLFYKRVGKEEKPTKPAESRHVSFLPHDLANLAEELTVLASKIT